MKNKKGISAIVATVLIILITVAAVTIIWAAIIPMIQDQIGVSTDCFDASAALTVKQEYSCVTFTAGSCNVATCGAGDDEACTTEEDCEAVAEGGVWTAGTQTIEVQVQRASGDFDLEGIVIGVGAAGNTVSETIMADNQDLPEINGAKVFTITDPVGLNSRVTEASVAAIVKTGNTVRVCDRSGLVSLPECAS